MHMADALLSPAVGGTMLAVSAVSLGIALKKTDLDKSDDNKIPLMGIMGAFVFAGQMINFTIPGTGSSGHIGGGLLLAAVLGAGPALITLASVLLIQCLFFADGGLLAWGCNVFNMGVVSCLLAYPFIYKPLTRRSFTKKSITLASVLAVVAGLQLGAFCVVLETAISGITELPFGIFVLAMQPIHLAIGLVEGLVTAAVLCYIHAVRPELLIPQTGAPAPAPAGAGAATAGSGAAATAGGGGRSGSGGFKKVLISLAVLTVITAAVLSIFASAYPDGLEWSMEKTAGTAELEREGPVYNAAAGFVEKTAFMPDYAFKSGGGGEEGALPEAAGTAAAGIVGSLITLLIAGALGAAIFAVRKKMALAAGRGGGNSARNSGNSARDSGGSAA